MWVIILSIIVLYSILHFFGKPNFWKLTRKDPFEAYNFFLENDCCFISHLRIKNY